MGLSRSTPGSLKHLVDLDASVVLGGEVRLHRHKPRLVSAKIEAETIDEVGHGADGVLAQDRCVSLGVDLKRL